MLQVLMMKKSENSLGEQMPIYFGSAMNNFGVQNMLESFLELAPAPSGRVNNGEMVEPTTDNFSGYASDRSA